MTDADDFTPVVEQGELEPASGLLDRLRRRRELAPVGPGSVRVLIAEDGTPIAGGVQLTGGEKRWSRARSWVRVDVGHHTLDYRVAFDHPSGRAGFVAAVTVEARVCDAAEAVQQGATSVKRLLKSALERMIGDAEGVAEKPDGDGDAIDGLMAMRHDAEAKVRAVRGSVPGLPRWLEANVLSATVAFDDDTRVHQTDLVGVDRSGKRAQIDRERLREENENAKVAAEGKRAVRRLWRDDLLEHLSDPSRRAFEIVFDNPTEQNITRAVREANQQELQIATSVLGVLQSMVERNLIDKNDPIYRTVTALSKRVQDVFAGGQQAIEAASEQEKLESPAEDGEPQPSEEQPGDRDFTDR